MCLCAILWWWWHYLSQDTDYIKFAIAWHINMVPAQPAEHIKLNYQYNKINVDFNQFLLYSYL